MARATVAPQIEILDCFTKKADALSANDVIELSGLPRSTVFRSLRLLTDHGFLLRDGLRKRYLLGPRILRLGTIARVQLGADDFIAGPLHKLSAETGETVTFSILDMPHRICTYVVEAPSDLRYEAHLGDRYPLHVGAAGKVILAHLPAGTIDALLASTDLKRSQVRDLKRDLETIRKDGYAITEGERVPGAIALAAPAFIADLIFGSVAIVGPAARSSTTILDHRSAVLEATAELTKKFSEDDGDGPMRPPLSLAVAGDRR
jgi:DNA-binding IclR family transcriptional regulator